MNDYLPYIVTGVVSGSIYALAALGLVLTYKTSGIFNFGHGAMAATAACAYYECTVNLGFGWPIGILLAVGVFGPAVGLLMEFLGRGLGRASTAMRIVATVGLLLLVQGLATLRYGASTRRVHNFLPQDTFRFLDVVIGYDQVITVAIGALASAGMYAYFRLTRTGTAMRAVVDDAALLDLTGVAPVRVRRVAWILGSCFASLSGVLIVPTLGLDVLLLTFVVVQSFSAAAIGRFTNLGLTYAGGLAVGIATDLTQKVSLGHDSLRTLPGAMPYIILVAVLLLTPRRHLAIFGEAIRDVVTIRVRTGRQRLMQNGSVGLLLLLVPLFVGSKIIVYTNALVYVLLFLSLALLVRTSGQVSLGQVGFAAVGAATMGRLLTSGVPWGLALLLAALAAVPVGAVLAIPAIRLSGLYLALATFGFGILLERTGYSSRFLFGGPSGFEAHRPEIFGFSFTGDWSYYYLVLAVVALAVTLVSGLERARLGRLLRALADSPTALTTHGADVNITRVIVFCFSAFLASLSGALLAPLFGTITGASFPSFSSLILLAVLAVAGRGTSRAAFIAAGLYFVVPAYVNSPTMVDAQPALFGATAIAVALLSTRPGLGSRWLHRGLRRVELRQHRSPVAARLPSRTLSTAHVS